MQLLCPNCTQSVTIADSEAGKAVNCPHCNHTFNAPELYSAAPPIPLPPTVPPPSTPPVPVTPAAASVASKAVPSQPPPLQVTQLPGYTRMVSISFHPDLMQWLAPIGLTIALVLTFFKWTGCYPAGYPAYTQNAWQALFSTMSVDPVSEKQWKIEQSIKDRLAVSWWMLPYLILLILATALAWAHHLVSRGRLRIPAFLQSLWEIRLAILAALAGIVLLFLVIQSGAGYGLEHAITGKVSEAYADETKAAKTPEEIQVVQMRIAGEVGSYQLGTTLWLWLTIVAHLLALIGIAAETAILKRGNKPPPRAGLFW